MVPENVLKYFLPNRPNRIKVASGSRGINTMQE